MSKDVQHSLKLETVLFLATGIGFTLLNLVIYLILVSLSVKPPIAAFIAFIALIIPHYLSYSKIVFRSTGSTRTYIKYFLVLMTSGFLNVALVAFFWAYLLADVLPAQILGLSIAVIVNYVLLKFFVFEHRFEIIGDSKTIRAVNALNLMIAGLALYISIAAILLYTTEILHADDWRHYRDYFFEKSFIESMFDRQNGHLMVIPNFIMLHNFQLFGGQMSNLAMINTGLFSLSGASLGFLNYRVAKSSGYGTLTQISAFFLGPLLFLVLFAPSLQLWGLVIHNHFVVLSVSIAVVFVSGIMGSPSKPINFLIWFFCALIGATSFSTGAAIGALGFAGAILNRCSLRVIAAYFFVGLFIAALGIGLIFSDRVELGGAIGTSLAPLPKFIVAFIGNLAVGISPHQDIELVLRDSLVVGVIAFVLWIPILSITVKHYFQKTRNDFSFSMFAANLLVGFSTLSALLIYLGRFNQAGVHGAITPRYMTWSAIFWVGLIAGYLFLFLHFFRHKTKFKITPVLFLLFCSLLVTRINLFSMENTVRGKHKYYQNRSTQIVMNVGDRPIRDRLWSHGGELPYRVAIDLRDTKRNIFAQSWTDQDGSFDELLAESEPQICQGEFAFRKTQRDDEHQFVGWAFAGQNQKGPLGHIYILDFSANILGHARPVFGKTQRSGSYQLHKPIDIKVLHKITPKLVKTLPGVSGHFFGNFRMLGEVKVSEVKLVGEDRYGNRCIVGQ